MTPTQKRLQPPALGDVMRDLSKGGDLSTVACLQQASGLVIEKPKEEKPKREAQPRKHPFAYLYIDDRSLVESEQRRRLETMIRGFKASEDETTRKLFKTFQYITVTLPGNTHVCAVKVDSKAFQSSRLAKYLKSRGNKHKLAVYMRKPRKDVQRSKTST